MTFRSFLLLLAIAGLMPLTLSAQTPVQRLAGMRHGRLKVAGAFTGGAVLSGLLTYLITRLIYRYQLQRAREDLLVEQRVNSAGVQHDLDVLRKKNAELHQTIMTLSQALGQKQMGAAASAAVQPVSPRVAEKVVQDAEFAHAELQFKELASQGGRRR